MKNSKLIQSLEMVPKSELKGFIDYVASPFFNKNEKLIMLVNILVKSITNGKVSEITKKKIFAQLFPKEAFDAQKVSDLMTYLYRLLEGFLVQVSLQENQGRQKVELLKSFRQKGMDKNFESMMRAIRKNSSAHFELSEDKLFYQYRLATEADLFFIKQDSRSVDKSIEHKVLNLDRFYLTAKLRNCCEMINRQNIVSETFDIRMLDEIKNHIKDHYEQFTAYPSILIYYQILLTLQESHEEVHYLHLIELLNRESENFNKVELRSMYDYAQNYCIKKINSGKTHYVKEIFNLYKGLLAKEIILDNGFLSQWDYKNIITVADRLKEFKWTEEFIENYKDKLPEKEKENAYAYNLASHYYGKKDYKKALRLLQTVEFTDVYYGLGARSLLLKVYYESDEFDALFSLFDSFKIYLRRNKLVSEYQNRVHMNLIKMTRRLANMKLKHISARKETMTKEIEKFKKRMEATSEITNLNWLMEKITELEPHPKKTSN